MVFFMGLRAANLALARRPLHEIDFLGGSQVRRRFRLIVHAEIDDHGHV
jgi:hypothetical protein